MAGALHEISFWDHVDELRKGLIRSAVVVAAMCAILFFFKKTLFDGIILAPASSGFFLYRWLGADVSLSIINIDITAQFVVHIKATCIVALILSVPYLLYEAWLFVAPALYAGETGAVRRAFLASSALFYLGLAVGYCIVLPLMLNFFQGYFVSESIPNVISLTSYMGTFSSTVLLFGLVFLLPVLAALLSRLGIIDRGMLRRGWRAAVFATVLMAALITPSGDPFSLLVVSIPLFLLYLLSILVCRKEGAGA